MKSCRLLLASVAVTALTGLFGALGAPLPPRKDSQDGPLGMKFVRVPKGMFYMGWDGDRMGRITEIKEDFELAIHTVTQEQWQAVMGYNPSYFSRNGDGTDMVKDIADPDLKQFPVENVSWDDAQSFIKKLNEHEKKRGGAWLYRLPTGAEWEYACRGGTASEGDCSFHFYFDKPTNNLSSNQANFRGNRLERTTKVGSYKPNKLGLYDMHGNVVHWCQDQDPEAEQLETYGLVADRMVRGGSWNLDAKLCQAATYEFIRPSKKADFIGFRLARVPLASK